MRRTSSWHTAVRADLGPILANGLMLFAGAGVLAGLALPLRAPQAWLAALGLAYVTGVAATMLVLEVLLVIGVPFGLPLFAAVTIGIAGAGWSVAILRRRREGSDHRLVVSRPRIHLRRPTPDAVVVILFVLAVGVFGAVGLDASASEPLDQWDAWSIWTRKAIMLVHTDSLVGAFWSGPAYEFMHQDYPLVVPLLEATFFRAGAAIDTQAVHVQLWILLVGFVWAAAWVASRVTRPLVWSPVLLLVLLAPGVHSGMLSGYADIAMALFLGLGVLLLGVWVEQRCSWQLWLGALLLGAAANVKNEGVLGAVAALLCLTVVLAVSERARLGRVAGAWALFVATVLPWRIWMAANDVAGDLPLGKGLRPSYLADRTERVWPSVKALEAQLSDLGNWLYLAPLGIALAIAAIVVGTRRDVAAFYLATGVTVFAGLTWAYWISPNDLAWHIGASANRVVAAVVLVAAAGSLHLGGILAREPRTGRQDDHVASPSSA
jgi:hypothetical protein